MVTAFFSARRPDWLSLEAAERAVSEAWKDVVSLLPDRWKSRFGVRADVMLVNLPRNGQTITAVLPNGQRTEIDQSSDASEVRRATARSRVALRLDEGEVLLTIVKLPWRAVSRLDEVVITNIPVWTPFEADDLYFKARAPSRQATGRNTRRETCDVELRCVPKAALAPRLAMLADLSIAIDEVWLGEDQFFSCDLGSRKTRAARRQGRFALALVALAVAQTCALSMIYCMHQDEQIAVLQGDVDRIRTAVRARAARVRMERDAARMLSSIEARATGRESMAYRLKLLADVLPAGARFRELNVTSTGDGSLTIVSANRIDPVNLLAATKLLTVTEVNDMGAAQENDHIYTVAFKAARSLSGPN